MQRLLGKYGTVVSGSGKGANMADASRNMSTKSGISLELNAEQLNKDFLHATQLSMKSGYIKSIRVKTHEGVPTVVVSGIYAVLQLQLTAAYLKKAAASDRKMKEKVRRKTMFCLRFTT